MILEVTQNNVLHLIPGKMSWMAQYYMEDHHCSPIEALRYLYSTKVYKKLEDESTKTWHLGPVALYHDILDEKEQETRHQETVAKKLIPSTGHVK